MQNLNRMVFYKAKFTVRSRNERQPQDLLWCLVSELRSWLCAKHNVGGQEIVETNPAEWTRFKLGSRLIDKSGKHKFYASSLFHISAGENPVVSWACTISEDTVGVRFCDYAPRNWTTEIGYQTVAPGVAEISYIIKYGNFAQYLGELAPTPTISVPRVIRKLLTNPDLICSCGDTELSLCPFLLEQDNFQNFKDMVFSENRKAPIIYVSPLPPFASNSRKKYGAAPKEIAKCVAGNALVYYANDVTITNLVNGLDVVGGRCYDGEIAVLYPVGDPNGSKDAVGLRSLPSELTQRGNEKEIMEVFRRVFSQDMPFYEKLFGMQDCQGLITQARHEVMLSRLARKKDAETNEAIAEFLKESAEREQAEADLADCMDELKQLKAENYYLTAQIKANQEKAARYDSLLEASQHFRETPKYPTSAEQIVRHFETVFGDRLAFTDRAYKSLKDCVTKPEVLWDALYAMATTMYDLFHDSPATALTDFTSKTGWACSAGVKATNNSNALLRLYDDTYEGKHISIVPHIKTGFNDNDPRSLRLYFVYDKKIADKIIIGSIGRHIENAGTRKIK